MCYYARIDFKCHDWRWGNMKLRCPRQPRIGETCGAKLPDLDNITYKDELCRVCQEKAVKVRRLEKEKDNIKRWSLEGDRFRGSLERARVEVRQLEGIISELEARRTSVQLSKSSSWGGASSQPGGPSLPSMTSLPYRSR